MINLKKEKKKKGFTLIELIVVMAILSILALVAVPRLSSFKESARKSNDLVNARNISNITELVLASGELKKTTDKTIEFGEYKENEPIKVVVVAPDKAGKLAGEVIGSKLKLNGTQKLLTSTGNSFWVKIDGKEEITVYNGKGLGDTEEIDEEKQIFPQK